MLFAPAVIGRSSYFDDTIQTALIATEIVTRASSVLEMELKGS